MKALLLNEGPLKVAQSESESSLETPWRAECESHQSIFTSSPHSKFGRIAWPDALAQQICKCTKVQIVKLFRRLQRKSKISQDELAQLGEQIVQSAEGTRSLDLQLCCKFEDKFPQRFTTV